MRWSSSDLVVSVLNCPLSKVILFVCAHTSSHTSALFLNRAKDGPPFTPTFNGARYEAPLGSCVIVKALMRQPIGESQSTHRMPFGMFPASYDKRKHLASIQHHHTHATDTKEPKHFP